MLKDTFSNRLQKALDLNNLKQTDLVERTKLDKSLISNYLSGKYKAKQNNLTILAQALGVSEAWLMGYDVELLRKNKPEIKSLKIPVLGVIPAGIPMEAIEDLSNNEFEYLSVDMLKGDKEYFALKVIGDSMYPEYLDGDILIVLKQNNCESGEDCVVMVNGDDATFKRVFKAENGITLQPLNNKYPAIFYSNDKINSLPVKILGIVVEFRRNIKKK